MTYENKSGGSNSVHCADFDARLADLLDGAMAGAELEAFRAHAEACVECGPLFTQAKAGMDALQALPEVEPPAHLVHNILAATTFAERKSAVATLAPSSSWWRRAAERVSPNLAPALAGMMQPRLAMTAAMAFFSISMLMNISGVNLRDLKNLDLRPSSIGTTASIQYHATTAKVVKYYENIRLFYELETRVRELKDAATSDGQTTAPAGEKQQQKKDNNNQNDSSQNPPKEQNEKYSLEKSDTVMAKLEEVEVPAVVNLELEGRAS